jgi:hypothetical protein
MDITKLVVPNVFIGAYGLDGGVQIWATIRRRICVLWPKSRTLPTDHVTLVAILKTKMAAAVALSCHQSAPTAKTDQLF